jgi:hypothetical protein
VLTEGKDKVEVRFAPKENCIAGRVFGIKITKERCG